MWQSSAPSSILHQFQGPVKQIASVSWPWKKRNPILKFIRTINYRHTEPNVLLQRHLIDNILFPNNLFPLCFYFLFTLFPARIVLAFSSIHVSLTGLDSEAPTGMRGDTALPAGDGPNTGPILMLCYSQLKISWCDRWVLVLQNLYLGKLLLHCLGGEFFRWASIRHSLE